MVGTRPTATTTGDKAFRECVPHDDGIIPWSWDGTAKAIKRDLPLVPTPPFLSLCPTAQNYTRKIERHFCWGDINRNMCQVEKKKKKSSVTDWPRTPIVWTAWPAANGKTTVGKKAVKRDNGGTQSHNSPALVIDLHMCIFFYFYISEEKVPSSQFSSQCAKTGMAKSNNIIVRPATVYYCRQSTMANSSRIW